MPPETSDDPKEKGPEPESAAQASAEPVNVDGGGSGPARRVYLPRKLLLAAVLLVSLAGLVGAYLPFQSYAAVWRRPIARLPRCVLAARVGLRKPSLVSGSEPNITPTGETVYLTPQETTAVHCVQRVSSPLAARFAEAFTEVEPELRALELLKILRDVPKDAESDREASAAYFVASGALVGLPTLPETTAANDEMDELHACRFLSRKPCPSRPPIPVVVWIAGVPSALGVLVVVGALGRAGFLRVMDWRRARRAAKASKSKSDSESKSKARKSESKRGKSAKT